MRRIILVAFVALLVIGSFLIWILSSDLSFGPGTFLMFLIPVVVLLYAIIFILRRASDAKQKLPSEDELSRRILLQSGSSSFQFSLFLWLILGSIEDRTGAEGHTVIGAGILGMAIIWVISWLYYRYIRRYNE